MRGSEAIGLFEILGFDPADTAVLIFRPDEIEVHKTSASQGEAGVVHYLDYPDILPQETFSELEASLKAEAPIVIPEAFQSIQIDVRGVSARVQSGLEWQFPWTPEPVLEVWLDGEDDRN